LGKALKLYFFKTYLRRENVNQLCWIEYKADGSVERHRSGVAEKVAAAKNVLLLIHGIIGDTEGSPGDSAWPRTRTERASISDSTWC
jgi:hypothetical protein